MPCPAAPCHAAPSRASPRHATPSRAVPSRGQMWWKELNLPERQHHESLPCHAMHRRAEPSLVLPCLAMPCPAVPCPAVGKCGGRNRTSPSTSTTNPCPAEPRQATPCPAAPSRAVPRRAQPRRATPRQMWWEESNLPERQHHEMSCSVKPSQNVSAKLRAERTQSQGAAHVQSHF